MNMRETRPARVLPCHQWSLVLTCFTLVCLHATTASVKQGNTRNTSRQPSPVRPGNMIPSNFSSSSTPSSPPTTANFIMECQSPAGDVYDHCWLDDNTLFIVHLLTKKVVKAIINRATKTCTYSYYSDHPPAPQRVACSPDGDEIYVASYQHSAVWVYDRYGLKAVWNPQGLVGNPWSVAVNRQIVVVGPDPKGPLYVYNRNRVYLAQISVSQNQFHYQFSDLTEEGVFVATEERDGDRLVVYDILHGSTIVAGGHGSENGRFDRILGVSKVGDYILVCDFNNDRVPVFSQNGGFQGNLEFKGTDMSRLHSIAYRSEAKLLVVSSYLHSYIKIFSLMT